MGLWVRFLALLSGLRIQRCRGVGCRCSLDPALLWLYCRPVATAPIRLLAWEPTYATGAAQEMAKRQKKFLKKVGSKVGNRPQTLCERDIKL